jgi:hypothetical protein
MVGELPTADTGDMIPVVLTTMDVGMVPNGVDDIVVVDGVIVVAPLVTDAETTLGAVDGVGTVGTVIEGRGRAGIAGGGAAGIVVPGI